MSLDIASPCTGICKLDEATGWCTGCGRTGDEIADWRTTTPDTRAAAWDQIPTRLTQLGVACRRLPWTSRDIRAFVQRTLEAGQGTWVMGVVGAVAEFSAPYGADVQADGDVITAHTQNGAITMRLDDDIRALTFDPPHTPEARQRVMLAVKRERGRLPLAAGLADLGPDAAPLLGGDQGRLFDLGLARKEARFCVRSGAAPVQSALHAAAGQPLGAALPHVAPALLQHSPTRVVETALGRIEVQGRIPAPTERSPEGPHTHLMPAHLATGRATPVDMDLPRAYLPGAIFYPPLQPT
ncbi:MAG: DUF1289 domain-containing protein [Pseudomonadota bacterium]